MPLSVTQPVRVLVVDDEPYITDVLSSALVFEGFATEEASTMADALTHARSGGFDCIVLDVMLPDGDGFEVCQTTAGRGHRDTGALPDGPGRVPRQA